MSDYNRRINGIREILADSEAAFVTSDISVTYLTGFSHSEGYVLIGEKESFFLVDLRYAEAAKKLVHHMEVVVFSNLFETVNSLLQKLNAETVIIESSAVTLSAYNNYCDKLSAQIDNSNRLSEKISQLRIVKSTEEITKLKKAQQIAESAYLEVLNFVKPGITEKEISARLEFFMKMKGAERVAFELITIAGKKTSLPHGVPSDNIVQTGDFVTFDIGAVYEGYHSDMTRTVAVGAVSDEQREIYNIVLNAHLEGIKAVKAGAESSFVDKTARDIIKNAGYGEYFGHSTGHGVGLEVHEAPYASIRSEHILKENMTLTVEPGIYLPDKFGVRIEDTVLVTKDGCDSFASIPKELIIL